MGCALRRDEFIREGSPVLRDAVSRESAKVVAFKLGITPRHARNLQLGECGTTWPVFMAAATEYPEIRDMVARWLAFDRTEEQLRKIREWAASQIEEGDSET